MSAKVQIFGEGKRGILPVTVGEIVNLLEQFAPPELAEDWDRIGLQIGHKKSPVTGILVSLDPLLSAVEFASEEGLNFLVSHHPFFFRPLEAIDLGKAQGKFLQKALSQGVAVFAAHTNLDSTPCGINDMLANLLGLKEVRPLQVSPKDSHSGLGRIGVLPKEFALKDFANQVKKVLEIPTLRMVGKENGKVRNIAVCGGSGSKLINLAREASVDCYVTADICYHEALEALVEGPFLIDPGHFSMERIMVPFLVNYLKEKISKKGWDLPIEGFTKEVDPFRFL